MSVDGKRRGKFVKTCIFKGNGSVKLKERKLEGKLMRLPVHSVNNDEETEHALDFPMTLLTMACC